MQQTHENRQLAETIYESFPVSQPAFTKLLGLLDIEASREVATAAVTLGGRSRLLINPDFVAEKCQTAFDLSILVLHELYHVVLGHTRLYRRATPILNWAFDAVINAQLSQLFPHPSQTALFRRCYAPDVFPECLLRPPEGWRTTEEKWHLTGIAGDVHRALYTENSTSYEELFKLLQTLDATVADGTGEGQSGNELGIEGLLGNHESDTESSDSELLKEIRNIIAQWPMVEKRSGRDQGDSLARETLALRRKHNAAVAILRRALSRLADVGIDGALSPKVLYSPADTLLPYRSQADRRAEVLSAAGQDVFFFRANTRLAGLARSELVHVYLDVSGSMDEVVRALYEALVPLLDKVAPKIHLFSTAVSDIDHKQLRRGVLNTTGGTSIDVVTAHIIKSKVKKALIVTDGWVGDIPSSHIEQLMKTKVKLHGVITSEGESAFLIPVNGKATKLPALAN